MLPNKYSNGSTKQYILIVLLSLVSALALFANPVIPAPEQIDAVVGEGPYIFKSFLQLIAKLCLVLPDTSVSALVVLIGLICLYGYYFQRRAQNRASESKIFFALSALFALFMIIGMSFQTFNSLDFIIQNKFQVLYSFTIWLGFTILFYVILSLIVYEIQYRKRSNTNSSKITDFLLEKHPIRTPFFLIVVCWLPYWIAFFPGAVNSDIAWQIGQYIESAFNQHHPIFSTLVYGKIIQIGNAIHNMVTGVALATFIQLLFLAASIACGMYYMRKWGVSKKIRLYIFLFFAFNPLFGCWMGVLVKDCAYFGIFFLFVLFLLDLIQKILNEQPFNKTLFLTGLFGVLSIFRNNGIYIVVCSLLAALFVCKKKTDKLKIWISSIMVGCTITLISNSLVYIFQADTNDLSSESLSIPFQQTARYVKEYPEEVTEEERIVLNTLFDYDRLAESYIPDISDPIKGMTVGRINNENLMQYFSVWWKMFLKHPIVYVEATINNIYAYFCPNTESWRSEIVSSYMDVSMPLLHNVNFVFSAQTKNICLNFLTICKKIPGLGLLWHIGTYTWIALFLSALAIYKKKYYLLLGCVPTFMNLLCCSASPVNGFFRYAMPHMLATPILIGWFIVNYKNKTNESTQKEDKKCKTKKIKKLQS